MNNILLVKVSLLSLGLSHTMSSMACDAEGQWASKLVAASSQYSARDWGAQRILGPCDVSQYDDSPNAWSPRAADSYEWEWIEVEFPIPVYSSGVIIREAFNPGAIRKIEIRIEGGSYLTVWEATSYPFTAGQVNDSRFSWEAGGDLTDAIRVSIDSMHVKNDWESIDSITLIGPQTLRNRREP